MKKILQLCFMLLLLVSCSSARYARGLTTAEIEERYHFGGTIQVVEYPSGERRIAHRRMVAYLPESYFKDTLRRYPVLYLLHGARGNELTWIDSAGVAARLDSLTRKGKAKEFILVTPNVNRYFSEKDYRDGRALNAIRAFWLLNGEAERHFMTVVATVDSLLRTIPSKEGRAIAGMSSGALQALYLSANHPDTFNYVGLFSPYIYPTFAAWGHPDVYGGLWRKLKRQFQDAPEGFHIYIGRADIFYPHAVLFDRHLTRKGYSHDFTLTPGGHEWYNWRAFVENFSCNIFQE